MKKINLAELTDIDFENFCKDILSYKLKENMRTFRKGKDKGIDIITLSEEKNWIAQVKFYIATSDSTMMNQLKKESEKVKKLKPERYFLCINKELTEGQYDKILEMFSNYLKKEDIYDQKIIQEIVEEKEAEYILEKWDKLWLPSPYFVQKFYEKFKSAKYEYEKQEIIKESKIFVETEVYRQAEKLINNKNVILIHGQPGARQDSFST